MSWSIIYISKWEFEVDHLPLIKWNIALLGSHLRRIINATEKLGIVGRVDISGLGKVLG